MTRTEANRKRLQDMAAGGTGEVEGVIYTLPHPDAHGNRYYIMNEGTRCLTQTKEQAGKLLNIGSIGV